MFLRIWFGICLVGTLFSLWSGTWVANLLLSLGGASKMYREDICCIWSGICLQTLLFFVPWIKIVTIDGKPLPWDKVMAASRSPFLVMNHTSFLDFFVFSSTLPFKMFSNGCRIGISPLFLAIFTTTVSQPPTPRGPRQSGKAAKLFDLPMYGPAVGTRCGSFPVHYSSNSSGNFKTDPEKQKKVMEDIQKHIDASGCIAICPEGQVAETPPNMQPFRRGAFGVPIKYEMPIWGLTMHGCWKGWPKAASIGGDPATITVSLDYLMTPKADATTTDVAAECQEKMQARMDAIIASLGEKKAE
eukprot:gene7168-228_t